ncbi:MAG: hypothetical protein ABWZ16_02830 [Microbacterium sp.]
MSAGTARDEPGGYELRVGRHLDDRWVGWFGDLTMTREPDGTTTMRGPVADQAALHGILIKIRDLGMVLLAVRPIDVAPSVNMNTAAGPASGVDPED